VQVDNAGNKQAEIGQTVDSIGGVASGQGAPHAGGAQAGAEAAGRAGVAGAAGGGRAGSARAGRLKMLLLLAICAAPMILSYLAYYVIKPSGRTNYGTLLDPRAYPIPKLNGRAPDGKPLELDAWQGKWRMLQIDSAACALPCQKKLFDMRQLRTAQGKGRQRVERIWLILDDAPVDNQMLANYEGTRLMRVSKQALQAWLPLEPGSSLQDHIYLIDPLGNLMMRWPKNHDPSKVKRDLSKLLYASGIG
jgi:hypothetical protein